MAFGCKMRDDLGLELGDRARHRLCIADVALNEAVTVRACHALDRRQRAGIGQLVKVQDLMVGVLNQVANEGRAYEAGPASNEDAYGPVLQASGANGRPL